MTQILARWLAILATGFTFVFFSELLFWGTPSLPQFLMTWGVYALLAYVFLLLVQWFHVNNLPSLFLAGAIYGWLTEGVIVATLYEALPQSISLTALSWHALITVCLGWYGLRRALRAADARPIVLWSVGVGLLGGLWLPLWGVEQTEGIAPFTLASLALLLLTAVPVLILSAWIQTAVLVAPRLKNPVSAFRAAAAARHPQGWDGRREWPAGHHRRLTSHLATHSRAAQRCRSCQSNASGRSPAGKSGRWQNI